MKNRLTQLVVLQGGAMAALVMMLITTTPDENGSLMIFLSMIIVSVVVITGLIVIDPVEVTAKDADPLVAPTTDQSDASASDNLSAS